MSQATIATTNPSQALETILVVEDDAMQRMLLQRLLRTRGYTVLEARDGPEALLLCELHEGPIQLVITDVVMPRMMSGPELAERLIRLRPDLKLLYTSAYTDDSVIGQAAPHRQVNFLAKPFMPFALANKVREVLDTCSASPAGRTQGTHPS